MFYIYMWDTRDSAIPERISESDLGNYQTQQQAAEQILVRGDPRNHPAERFVPPTPNPTKQDLGEGCLRQW